MDIVDAVHIFEGLSHDYENFLMDNPLCPNFMWNSGLSQKIYTILEFNYEFLMEVGADQLQLNLYQKYSFRPFQVKNGLKESVLANSELWESYSAYVLDCLKLETLFARDKIDWALAHGQLYFYKNEYALSYSALQKTHALLLAKITGLRVASELDLAMFKKRVNRLAPAYQEAFRSCHYYLTVLRKSLLNHFSNSTQSRYALGVLMLFVDMLEVFEFLPDIYSVQEFIHKSDIAQIVKYYPLNPANISIVNAIKNNEFCLSKQFVLDLTVEALSEVNSDLSEVLM